MDGIDELDDWHSAPEHCAVIEEPISEESALVICDDDFTYVTCSTTDSFDLYDLDERVQCG